jgi:hypothetical protein
MSCFGDHEKQKLKDGTHKVRRRFVGAELISYEEYSPDIESFRSSKGGEEEKAESKEEGSKVEDQISQSNATPILA